MSASLVGSEMCIRDSEVAVALRGSSEILFGGAGEGLGAGVGDLPGHSGEDAPEGVAVAGVATDGAGE
eukprot:13173811-Alexandrium_andersonii.AAC.1